MNVVRQIQVNGQFGPGDKTVLTYLEKEIFFESATLLGYKADGTPNEGVVRIYNTRDEDTVLHYLQPGWAERWRAAGVETRFSLAEYLIVPEVAGDDGILITYSIPQEGTPPYMSMDGRLELACLRHAEACLGTTLPDVTFTRGFDEETKGTASVHFMVTGGQEQNYGVFDMEVKVVVASNSDQKMDETALNPLDAHNERVGMIMNCFSNLRPGDAIDKVLQSYVPALYIQNNTITRPTRTIERATEGRMFVSTLTFHALCSGDDILSNLEGGVGVWGN